MPDKPKLLWHSNAPHSPTGYGAQTGLFTPLLTESYEVAVSSFYGVEGARLGFGDVLVLPGIGGDWGNTTLPMHAEKWLGGGREGLIVSLMDVWVLNPAAMRGLNLACWVPVDHDPAPPGVRGFFEESQAVPIAMSKFGVEKLEGLDPLYCPHGVDTEAYRPVPKEVAREVTNIPQDTFVVGMVAANKGNPSRKAFAEALLAFKVFHEKHPDSKLYLHCEMTGRVEGVHLFGLIDQVGLDRNAVLFADQYRVQLDPYAPETMAKIYSSCDVLLSASCGEGFGIPVVEAQACGVPVIVSDFSAQPELCFAGWKVTGRPYYTPQASWQMHPDVEDIAEALTLAHDLPDATREKLSEQARAGALEYDVRKVLSEHMLPALEKAQERFAEREAQTLKVAA